MERSEHLALPWVLQLGVEKLHPLAVRSGSHLAALSSPKRWIETSFRKLMSVQAHSSGTSILTWPRRVMERQEETETCQEWVMGAACRSGGNTALSSCGCWKGFIGEGDTCSPCHSQDHRWSVWRPETQEGRSGMWMWMVRGPEMREDGQNQEWEEEVSSTGTDGQRTRDERRRSGPWVGMVGGPGMKEGVQLYGRGCSENQGCVKKLSSMSVDGRRTRDESRRLAPWVRMVGGPRTREGRTAPWMWVVIGPGMWERQLHRCGRLEDQSSWKRRQVGPPWLEFSTRTQAAGWGPDALVSTGGWGLGTWVSRGHIWKEISLCLTLNWSCRNWTASLSDLLPCHHCVWNQMPCPRPSERA